MTMIVEGYVQALEQRPTKTGKTMYVVKVNGVGYGAGMYPPKFKQGDFISFTSSMNGNFHNMETRTVTVKQAPPMPVAPTGYIGQLGTNPPKANSGWDDRQDIISKQAALNSAQHMVEILASCGAIVGLDKAKTCADKMKLLNALVDEYTSDYYKQNTGKNLELDRDSFDTESPPNSDPMPAEWE